MNTILFKLNHTLTSFVIFFTIYIFGAFPEKFYILHTLKVILYFAMRFYSWKQKKFHYYMFDFCYFMNIIACVGSIYFNDNIILQKIIFTCSNGPLAFAVIFLGNKLVYHSNDYIVSSFIHTSPMLLSYINRWNISKFSDEITLYNYFEHIYYSIIMYFVWFIPYYIILYILLYYRTIEKNNMTMFDYSVENKLKFIKKITQKRRLQQIIYSIIHFTFYSMTIFISPLMWYNQTLHFCHIVFIILVSIWNGSSYYCYKMQNKQEN